MSDRIELLAILLSGFFPPFKRERVELQNVLPANDHADLLDGEASRTQERPTLRLLRLVGRRRVHADRF